MSVIIDQFEVIVDAQQDREAEKNTRDGDTASAAPALKPSDINAIIEQRDLRIDRVRAH